MRKVVLFSLIAMVLGIAFARAEKSEDVRDLAKFKGVIVKGGGDVKITHGSPQKVTVIADADDLKKIYTEVEDQKLIIYSKGMFAEDYEVEIVVEELQGVSAKGSGDIEVGSFESSVFIPKIHGSGNITINALKAGEFSAIINGSGDLKVTGSGDEFEATVRGSGDVDAIGFKTKTAEIEIMGSGNCSIDASESIEADIFGSGDIEYKGDPTIETNVVGSGSVKKVK